MRAGMAMGGVGCCLVGIGIGWSIAWRSLSKYTVVMRPHFESFGDRFSERKERMEKEARAKAAVAAATFP
jgi:hypothetical protein